jgi:hypothetical protein
VRHFGWIPVDGQRAVGTNFYHLGGLPLWPSNSEIVDRSTMVVTMEREWLWRVEKAHYQAVDIPRHGRSVIAGYLRTWGVVVAAAAISALVTRLTLEMALAYLGVVPLVVGRFFRRWVSIRRGEPMMLLGLAMVFIGVAGMFAPALLSLLVALAAIGALQWTRGFTYRDAAPKPKIARSPLTIPKAVARIQPPAPPVIVPVHAPEHVEPSTEAPRFLT